MLKNVNLTFYLPHQGDFLLNFYEGYMNNLSTVYCSANLFQQKAIGLMHTVIKLGGMSSLTYNKSLHILS